MALYRRTAIAIFCFSSQCLAIVLPDTSLRVKVGSVIESRELCYDDDILWSFQYWSHDSIPYCSSLLDIEDKTVTADPVTSYTTTSTIVTTEYDDPTDTVTVPQTTVYTTTTTTLAGIWRRQRRRQIECSGSDCSSSTGQGEAPPFNFTEIGIPYPYPTPIAVIAPNPIAVPQNTTQPPSQVSPFPTLIAPNPFPSLSSTNPGPTPITENPVPSILADGEKNASIASGVYSACSCLRLKPKTVDITPTVQTTRTISGIDYEASPTVTAGTTTVLITVEVLSSVVFTRLLSSGIAAPSGRSISGVPPLYPTGYSFLPSGTAIVGPPVYFSQPSGYVSYPMGTAIRKNPTAPITGTGQVIPTFISPPALNVSIISAGPAPTNVSFIVPPPLTPPSPIGSPISIPLTPVIVNGNRTESGLSSLTASIPISPPLSFSSPTANLTAAISPPANSTPSALPIGGDINPAGCPTINNTIYTDSSSDPSQQFQIQCYRQYTGPSYIGLTEPNFGSCMGECDKVNLGFSDLECFGVTFLEFPSGSSGVNCQLKTQSGLAQFLTNELAVSAVLLNVPQPIVGLFEPPPSEVNGVWYPA